MANKKGLPSAIPLVGAANDEWRSLRSLPFLFPPAFASKLAPRPETKMPAYAGHSFVCGEGGIRTRS